MLIFVVALFAVAMFFLTLSVSVAVSQRAQARDSLRRLDSYEITRVHDREMLEPFSERVVAPARDVVLGAVRRVTPAGYVETVTRKVVLAGSPPGYEVDRVLILKILGAASVIVWVPLVFGLLGWTGLLGAVVVALAWVLSFLGPDVSLSRRIEARQHLIRTKLPDVLDLLVISVEAGLGFEQALERTATAVPGPLSDEFRRMLQETRLGATRADALRALDERTDVPELRSFILAMIQADTFGVSIAGILRAQAAEMRIRRRQRAQEQAQKAPIKLLVPLVFCVFPAIFVVVLVPALIQFDRVL